MVGVGLGVGALGGLGFSVGVGVGSGFKGAVAVRGRLVNANGALSLDIRDSNVL